MTRFIDLNCDIGEHDSEEGAQREASILPHVSSANVACGLHAGDASIMRKTMQAAREHGLAVGAHPSLADRANFGRRELPHSADDVYELTLYQIGASAALADAVGVRLNHVKPHGALYNMAARDRVLADAIAQAVRDFDSGLVLFGLSGSELIVAAEALGVGDELAHTSIRFGIGRFNTEEEVDFVIELVVRSVNRLRELSPLWDMHQDGIDISQIEWTAGH